MRFQTWIAPAFAVAALCLSSLLPHSMHSSAPSPDVITTSAASPYPASRPASILFPHLNDITALSVSTPERSFHFHLDHQGAVHVNGSRADHEIFSTLLDQIRELPVEQHTAFAPSAQDLLLTLVVSTDARQHTARFYSSSDGGKTRIVLDGGNTPEYRQTNIWRVGTLMMACEGTRILDDHGAGSK